MAKPLNVVYLHSHDTGRYIQPYGYPVPTPCLQKLAEEGVVFRQAFCLGPTCSPSRAALLTGQYPHQCGMTGLAHRGWRLNDYTRHLVHTLRRGGYRSYLAGAQHVIDAPHVPETGYDEILQAVNHTAGGVVPAVQSFLAGSPRGPFFLDVGFTQTHRTFGPPSLDEDPRYCRPPGHLPDTPRTRRDFASFQAAARVLDRAMGAVLDALEANRLDDSTLVICTTDHGIAFPDMKCNLTDHGTGVLLILRGPGGFAGGRVIDAMVSHLDIGPTLCELAGIEPPDWFEGKSLLPLVRGEAEAIHDELFFEISYHAAYEPQRAVRTTRWKYIRRFGGRPRPVLSNCDDSPSKDVWLEHGWGDRPVEPEQLYDLVFDPQERRNVAADPACRAVLDDLRGRLERWMKRTDDPLLRGPVPAPPNAVVNDPDALSPGERPKRVTPPA